MHGQQNIKKKKEKWQTKSLVLCAHWDPNMFTLIKYLKSNKFLC